MQDDKFKIEKITVEGQEQYKLEGVVDEDTDLSQLTTESGPLYLNLSGISNINSLGIRGWVNFFKEQSAKEIFYVECPPVIVRQMSMIPSFCGSAQVLSVFAPYVCDNCETEKLVLVGNQDFSSDPMQIQDTLPCENCGNGEMELDANPQQYFSFRK